MGHPRRWCLRARGAAALAAPAIAAASGLCGCAASGNATHGAAPAAPVPPESSAISYDWHRLIPAPFGTLLKDMPVVLTEVLQFQDAAESGRASEDQDCYRMKGASPPAFLGREPEDYVLCFEHDRLNRIEASVQLPAASAAQIFAAACAGWQAKSPGTPASCEGREGSTDFSAHLLISDPAEATAPATVSIDLLGVVP
jgi:hypothetical protein